VLQRNPDQPNHKVTAVSHPVWTFVTDPDHVVEGAVADQPATRTLGRMRIARVPRTVLETHEVTGRLEGWAGRQKAGLHPAQDRGPRLCA
jgi:hypothetical protein